jgi:hypothetical protein
MYYSGPGRGSTPYALTKLPFRGMSVNNIMSVITGN